MSQLHPSQAAWNAFLDRLKEIGEKITEPTGARGERERAEGYRYLVRLLASAHELEVGIDRRFPVLERMMSPKRKFKGDGCDTIYNEAKLDPAHSYRCRVHRGDDLFFSATVYAYDDTGAYKIVDHLIDDDIDWGDDKTAEIHLSAERPDGVANWIRLEANDPILFTREYFPDYVDRVDRGHYRRAMYDLQCLDPGVDTPAHYTEADLETDLQRVIDFVDDATNVSLGLSIFVGLNRIEYQAEGGGERKGSMTRIEEGKMILDEESSDEYSPEELAAMIDPKLVANNLPGPGIQYIGGWFKLAPDEAIEIEGTQVPCRYWNCQILTRYLESGDYRHYPVSINDRQVKYADDGSFRIYACDENPGVENWLSTQGYANGQILIRTLLAEPPMEATFKVVKKADIRR